MTGKPKILPKGWPSDFIQAFLIAERAWWAAVHEDDYENADNFRVAREGHPDEVSEYERRRADGCCGSEDVTLDVTWDGNTVHVLYGFNYGH